MVGIVVAVVAVGLIVVLVAVGLFVVMKKKRVSKSKHLREVIYPIDIM